MHAIKKYETSVTSDQSDEWVLDYFRREMANPNAIKNRPLKTKECIEVVKYLNRLDLIAKLEAIRVPKFELNILDLEKHQQKIQPTQSLDKNLKFKLNFGLMLKDLRLKWIDSDFTLTNEDLLKSIDEKSLQKYTKKNVKNS
jgi:hypothetical protein